MSAGGGDAEGDCELNLAPIVDCFTVLIAYLLVSMSFISLSIFEAGVAATGPAPASVTQPSPTSEIPFNLSIALNEGNRIELKLTGGKQKLNQEVNVEAKAGIADFEELKNSLKKMMQDYPEIKEANISADP